MKFVVVALVLAGAAIVLLEGFMVRPAWSFAAGVAFTLAAIAVWVELGIRRKKYKLPNHRDPEHWRQRL